VCGIADYCDVANPFIRYRTRFISLLFHFNP